ncbi:MAG: thiamine-phosphate kinase [Solirubrobacterales bacterium]|nr:thiamine-phosphate kinase [Solirubrobacterales bacterium]
MDRGTTESDLIELLRSGSGASARLDVGIGDDAAVTLPGGATATSVDAVVEGVHFRTEWSPPEAVAHKALATALSDLAAMAAEPGEVYVTLGIPSGTSDGYLEDLAAGFMTAADKFGTVLAGGDTVSSPVLFAAVTVVGHASAAAEFVLRSGAAPGEVVAVTGRLGGAAAGLWLLENDATAVDGLDSADRAPLIDRQLRPSPRLYAGRVLGRLGATAMVDVSDGLARDLGHVAEMSDVAITCDARMVPAQTGVAAVESAAGRAPQDFALGGGEDYELAVTLPGSDFKPASEALRALDLDLTAIGRVIEGTGFDLVDEDGQRDMPTGFDHLG